ncbi:MAG: membrane associated rhomboid family serine protease [Halobacteriales archaeon]|jgi:membrane associated rhomboid family serine protease
MAKCDYCGEEVNMPYQCRHCGEQFCAEHRLPENHDCPGMNEWNDPDGVFDSGFDDSVEHTGRESSGVLGRLGIDTGRTGFSGYFKGNMTYLFLALMWLTFLAQELMWAFFIDVSRAGIVQTPETYELYKTIFTLRGSNVEYVWTWFTSIFAHGGFNHIIGNSIVIFFFGRLVEDYVGSRDFTLLFIGSGMIAGLGQVGVIFLTGEPLGIPILGASGAGLAIMGILTVLNPSLRVYLYFLLPIPIWVITGFYALISVLGIIGPLAGGVANGAHLVGLLIGLWYGQRVKDRLRVPDQFQFGGGGPGGPGGPGGGRRF